MTRQSFDESKEPWLAVLLSTIFPSIGHFYAGEIIVGLLITVSAFCLLGIASWNTLSPAGNLQLSIQLLLGFALLYVVSLFDVHRRTRKRNNVEFEQRRKEEKDPWLSVFLSNIIPGLGQMYGGSWIAGILFFLMIAIADFVSESALIFLIGSTALSAFCLYHAYVSTSTQRARSQALIITVCLAIAATNIVSVSFALATRKYVAEARYIPSESMKPTLVFGDRLLVNKLNYRYTDPQRGDIVVYNAPEDALSAVAMPTNEKVAYVHRIVGLPGETVEVRDGSIYINGEALVEPYILSEMSYRLPPSVVPEAAYFVLGDNRNSSSDSHVWGFISRDAIIGEATQLFWPPGRASALNSKLQD